jgi:lipoyl(octanoyl) transferase
MLIENWGEIQYQKGHLQQEKYVEDLVSKKSCERIILCSHPSVVTLGKKATEQDLHGWDGPIFKIKRGGKATYHGRSQVVAYPIVN